METYIATYTLIIINEISPYRNSENNSNNSLDININNILKNNPLNKFIKSFSEYNTSSIK